MEINWELFNEIRNVVNKEVEIQRNNKIIKRSFELEVNLPLNSNNPWVNQDLKNLLLVGEVKVISEKNKITSNVFAGVKCQRCWKLFPSNDIDGDICKRCKRIVGN